MSRKTLALLVSLLTITVVLLGLALNTSNKKMLQQNPQNTTVESPTPVVPVESVLMMDPNPAFATTGVNTVNVNITTGSNEVSAVQLEVKYDPKVLTNVSIVPGTFFDTPQVLPLGVVDAKNGRVSTAIVPASAQGTKVGSGTVAVIKYSVLPGATGTTLLEFMPKTLVTAKGVEPSVLKAKTGTTIQFGTAANGITTTNTTPSK